MKPQPIHIDDMVIIKDTKSKYYGQIFRVMWVVDTWVSSADFDVTDWFILVDTPEYYQGVSNECEFYWKNVEVIYTI
jgi:hypothetical protein